MKHYYLLFVISHFTFLKTHANEIKSSQGEKNQSKYEAVVRIENSALNPDYKTPWNSGRDSGGNGTGWLVDNNKFLTNAHVVSNSRIVYIKKVGDAKPYRAKIIHIAHDCDLAMLELEDPSAFEGVKPFEVGELPQLDTTVKVIGYPIGGERISITSGVVSRIDFLSYSHTSVDLHLTVQIDAAINPGNSGGPVIQDGKVVGVAFQGYSGNIAQNTGYMIPPPVIKRFLKDVEDGNYDHYVDLSMSDFPLINPSQRIAYWYARWALVNDKQAEEYTQQCIKHLVSLTDVPLFSHDAPGVILACELIDLAARGYKLEIDPSQFYEMVKSNSQPSTLRWLEQHPPNEDDWLAPLNFNYR